MLYMLAESVATLMILVSNMVQKRTTLHHQRKKNIPKISHQDIEEEGKDRINNQYPEIDNYDLNTPMELIFSSNKVLDKLEENRDFQHITTTTSND